MSIEWQNIKSFNNSQNNAFEELVCQLAREEPIAKKKEFYRVAAPDGGVEAYCVLDSGEEYGWQAKYFSSMSNSQWSQLKESFKTALRTHPKLIKYYICIPLDRQDPRRDNQSWFMDKWNAKVQEWSKYANDQGRNITFEYWGSSELIHRLSKEKHAGRKLFWFSKDDFSDEWFQLQIENSICNLGHRYTPELNFELDIAKHFDAINRNNRFREYFKKRIELFLSILKKLDKEILSHDFEKLADLLNSQLEISKKSELIHFDTESIKAHCKFIEESLYKCRKRLKNIKNELSEEVFKKKNASLDKAYDALNELLEFIKSPTLALADLPVLLLSGKQGMGKSHLLADIALKRSHENKACLLLLGQHFASEESPWTQILKNLLRLNCNEKELLGALNAKAEAQGERLIFMVDAINEGRGRFFWNDHIKGFINDFSKYPWLGLVLSIRTSYETLLTPRDLIPDDAAVRIVHHGFEYIEYKASCSFFSQYGIERPNAPLLNPEFSNPLFLKLFCEGLNRSEKKRIPKDYGGITSIIHLFLVSVDEKLSHPIFYDYQPASSKQLVKKVVNALIQYKLENNLSFIPYDSAIDIANNIVLRFSLKKGFIDNLISEGVLSKNTYWTNSGDNEEGVYFAYERFEDHLTAAYLLEKHLDANNPEIAFQEGGALAQYIYQGQYQGIIEALSIQLPEKIGKELYELVSSERKLSKAIFEAFIESLIWRKSETIKEKAEDYINNYVLVDEYASDLFLQMVYLLSSAPEHLFNANYLYQYLMQFSLADRDAIWTTYLHDKDCEDSAMQRLINWARQDDNKDYLSAESRLLACKALAWLFTSTNIGFRDTATKALVCVLENNLLIITQLLADFNTVNDPYVYERILAAAYGAVLRSADLNGLAELSGYILLTVFKKEEVYPNVLVRDYARNIIEYALYEKIFVLDNPEVIRPPYKSQFPDSLPSNEEIDAYKYDYKLDDSGYYWGQNAILRSMVTEYGRGIGSYGDFGRYTFQSTLYDWEYKFDLNDLSNYACKLIFGKYGYDIKKHGEFDNHASNGDRHTNKKERIGKKYQWLALYEVLARVADNYPMQDRSTGWHEDQKYIWYEGPWEPFIRNIDPTSIYSPSDSLSIDHNESWWDKTEYKDWDYSHQDWLISTKNLPNPKEIIELRDTQNNEWLVLETYPTWDESVPVGYDKYDYPHKHLWYQIRSYLVHEDQADHLITWAKQQHLMGRWFPEGSTQYQVFSREYYWSPAYQFFDNPYYGRSQWADVHEKDDYEQVIGEVMVTTESHNWESGADHREQPSYFAPREFMYDKMQLQYSKNIGEWLNTAGEVVCFDPSANQEDSPCLLIRKDVLLKFLDENNLKIFWTCLGEKQIFGDTYDRIKYSQWLEVSGVFTLSTNGIDGILRPLVRKVGR